MFLVELTERDSGDKMTTNLDKVHYFKRLQDNKSTVLYMDDGEVRHVIETPKDILRKIESVNLYKGIILRKWETALYKDS